MIQNVFLITSAINTRFGVFDKETRVTQTIETINSINKYAPNSTIILLEMSADPLDAETLKRFEVHYIIVLGDDANVKNIYKSDNWDIVKNYTEVLCFKRALEEIDGLKLDLSPNARIFKISGRYCLTDKFVLSKHYEFAGPVFATRRPSQFDSKMTGGINFQYMSRCWSFSAHMLQRVAATFASMKYAMDCYYTTGGYADIEHLLYLFMVWYPAHTIPTMGVTGKLGPNGNEVSD